MTSSCSNFFVILTLTCEFGACSKSPVLFWEVVRCLLGSKIRYYYDDFLRTEKVSLSSWAKLCFFVAFPSRILTWRNFWLPAKATNELWQWHWEKLHTNQTNWVCRWVTEHLQEKHWENDSYFLTFAVLFFLCFFLIARQETSQFCFVHFVLTY